MEQTENICTSVKKLILSQDYEVLAKCLTFAFYDNIEGLKRQWIFVPNIALKQWLLLQIAKNSPSNGVSGYKVVTLDEMLFQSFPKIPTRQEMLGNIYLELSKIDSLELRSYLDSSEAAKMDLASKLSNLFFSYGKYGAPAIGSWQGDLFAKFQADLPIAFLDDAPFFDVGDAPCHFFGFDHLPPIVWSYLDKAPSAYFYMFSPCSHFWEDTLTKKEQLSLAKVGKRKGVSIDEISELETYFSTAPVLLGNLGKIGRQTLKAMDSLSFDMEQAYAPILFDTALGVMQKEIILFEKLKIPKDTSIEVFRTGSSDLNQIETLKNEIVKLINVGVNFGEMCIVAPSIQNYIPLIEFVFGKANIPFRFPHISVNGAFHRGLICLIGLAKGPFDAAKVLNLFENPAFRNKFAIVDQQIKWLKKIFLKPNWEEGAKEMLKDTIFLFEGPSQNELGLSDFDLFEKLLGILCSLQEDFPQTDSKTFEQWAQKWEEIAIKYLSYQTDEQDIASYSRCLNALKKNRIKDKLFPFEVIEEFLTRDVQTSCNGSHLHAVSCVSIDAFVPARATFIIGMDEESFPRKDPYSSLDLVNLEPKPSEMDRYLFLQMLLNTKEYLRIFYGHISGSDGKEIGPCLPVQELLSYLGDKATIRTPKIRNVSFEIEPQFSLIVPPILEKTEPIELALSSLLSFSSHPWRHFLQKVKGMYLEDRQEKALNMIRASFAKPSLKWELNAIKQGYTEKLPPIFQEALVVSAQMRKEQMQKQIDVWGKKLCSLSFLHTAGANERFPLKIELENGQRVEIVGDIEFCLNDGALHFGADTLSSLIRYWPAMLVTCVALSTDKIYFLKTTKIKHVEDPLNSLRNYLEYYFRFSNHLSPLIPEWADSFLRKDVKDISFDFEDPICQWLFARLEAPKFHEFNWLKEAFDGLIKLYPTRG